MTGPLGSLLIGIAGSIAAWTLILLVLSPRIEVSGLNKIEEDRTTHPCGCRYRIKVRNRSRLFPAADVRLDARLVFRGLDPDRPHVRRSSPLLVGDGGQFIVFHERDIWSGEFEDDGTGPRQPD